MRALLAFGLILGLAAPAGAQEAQDPPPERMDDARERGIGLNRFQIAF